MKVYYEVCTLCQKSNRPEYIHDSWGGGNIHLKICTKLQIKLL